VINVEAVKVNFYV